MTPQAPQRVHAQRPRRLRAGRTLVVAVAVIVAATLARPVDAVGIRPRTFEQRVEACELAAVADASAQLPVSGDGPLVDSLRVAAGTCTRFVLAVAAPASIPRVCSAVAAWSAARTARELRRRIAAIEGDAVLKSTGVGAACVAALRHELKTTRVVLRAEGR
jgi:hypothetical protein